MQEIILGILGTGFLTLLSVLIYGLRSDMSDMRADMRADIQALRTEMAEGFQKLAEAIAVNGQRIAANGERIATLEGIISVTHPRPENPPQLPVSTEAEDR
ncbi:MAG: hypothetical protein OXH10_06415 [bacterium]|nr:hypothetical protein [bacterium]MCY3580354.1 hypothetical protein [bacterium]MCY3653142.1 hypothetical protein [bacterium]MDE0644324.1 hypothetical protein [bacterium]MYD04234.1 hypothetical protein [Acidimicrobiia bacterium]